MSDEIAFFASVRAATHYSKYSLRGRRRLCVSPAVCAGPAAPAKCSVRRWREPLTTSSWAWAGCVLANRLSAGGKHSVLLIEAGGTQRSADCAGRASSLACPPRLRCRCMTPHTIGATWPRRRRRWRAALSRAPRQESAAPLPSTVWWRSVDIPTTLTRGRRRWRPNREGCCCQRRTAVGRGALLALLPQDGERVRWPVPSDENDVLPGRRVVMACSTSRTGGTRWGRRRTRRSSRRGKRRGTAAWATTTGAGRRGSRPCP